MKKKKNFISQLPVADDGMAGTGADYPVCLCTHVWDYNSLSGLFTVRRLFQQSVCGNEAFCGVLSG